MILTFCRKTNLESMPNTFANFFMCKLKESCCIYSQAHRLVFEDIKKMFAPNKEQLFDAKYEGC